MFSPEDFMEGVMVQGTNLLSFVSFHLNSNEQSQGRVLQWVCTWWVNPEGSPWGSMPLVSLRPKDWLALMEALGPCVWIPPPAAKTKVMQLLQKTAWLIHLPPKFSWFCDL